MHSKTFPSSKLHDYLIHSIYDFKKKVLIFKLFARAPSTTAWLY